MIKLRDYTSAILDVLRENNILICCTDQVKQNYEAYKNELLTGCLLSILNNHEKFEKPLYINYYGDSIPNGEEGTCIFFDYKDHHIEYDDIEKDDRDHKPYELFLSQVYPEHKFKIITGTKNKVNMVVIVFDKYQYEFQLHAWIKTCSVLLNKLIVGMPSIRKDENDKIELIKTVLLSGGDNIDKLEEMLVKLSNVNWKSIEDLRFKELLINASQSALNSRIKSAKSATESSLTNLERCASQYKDLLKVYNDNMAVLQGLQCTDSSSTEEEMEKLFNYVTNIQGFSLDRIEGNRMIYDILLPVSVYNEDAFKNNSYIADGRHRSIYQNVKNKYNVEDVKMVLDKIFLEKEYKLWFCSKWEYNFDNVSDIKPLSKLYSASLENEYVNAMCQPHLKYYECTGEYTNYWRDAFRTGDNINAIQATISCSQNINFADSAVTEKFTPDLMKRKCISKDGKTFYSGAELIDVLKKEKMTDEKEKEVEEKQDVEE